MRLLAILLTPLLAFALQGCRLWPECPGPASVDETWTRRLEVTQTQEIFEDASHPLETATLSYQPFHHLYQAHPSERDESVAANAPTTATLTFLTVYEGVALRSWMQEGVLADSAVLNAYTAGYIHHQLHLEGLDTLAVGTYPLAPNDTAGPRRVNVRLQLTHDRHGYMVLMPTEISGSITILQRFTKKSGKLSYSLRTTLAPGQKSAFEGTVTFKGVKYDRDCQMPGVP